MNIVLRVSLLVAIAAYLVLILVLLRKKSFNLKYSLLWMFMAVVLLLMVAFPQMVVTIADIIGVSLPINAIFMAFIFFILLMVVSLTSIISKQHREIKTLIQNVAILQKRVSELENKN
ncbi:MAG: DUF2304 domain-containing protein [Ruminococcaceae bacterium]|nr:DUF2304 domain-containing protein [Oscillospiraceae bacterium]